MDQGSRMSSLQTRWSGISALWAVLRSLVVAVLLAAISVIRQGFQFGIENNVFHIPVVLGWATLPQFHGDALIQSLAWFGTPVFPALSLVLDETTIRDGFLAMHLLTRVLTCLALLRLLAVFGVEDRLARAIAALGIVLVVPAYGYSTIGRGGMFLTYFTHSELAQAVALLALVEIARGRIRSAFWMGGLAFALNAFVGAWLTPLLAAATLRHLAAAGPRNPVAWRQVLAGAVGFALCATPILAWVARVPSSPEAFEYRAFLQLYFADHFLLDWSDPGRTLGSLAGLVAFALALPLLPPAGARAAGFLAAGLFCVFLLGIAVGELATNRLLLNLHLLRVDALLTWVALAVIAAALARIIAARQALPVLAAAAVPFALMRLAWAPALLAGTLAVLLLLSLLVRRMAWLGDRVRLPYPLAAAAMLGALALAHLDGWHDESAARPPVAAARPDTRQLEGRDPLVPDWAEAKRWIAANTPEEAIFLVPLRPGDFRIDTRRQAFVDWKQGASVMWMPSTYAEWARRYRDVRALASIGDMLAYAGAEGIDFVLLDKRMTPEAALAPHRTALVFENRWFALLPVRPGAASQPP